MTSLAEGASEQVLARNNCLRDWDLFEAQIHDVTGRIDTGRAVRNREYQLDETKLGKAQIVNLSITFCKTIVN
jgi:hypothetical protein